jgi:hypothetical protein
VNLDYGVAQFVPIGDSETQLALLTPDFRENLKGVMFKGAYLSYLNADGVYSAENPRAVKDTTIDAD